MKRFLPGRTELAIFLTVAVIGAAICQASQVHDLSMSLLAIPIFICAALMGMYRSGFLGKQFGTPVIYRTVESEDETAE
jgi:thiamine transporter ThiT